MATPPTPPRGYTCPHLGRKRPSARVQMRRVVASSSAEMAPAAFTCSATSCKKCHLLSPRQSPDPDATCPPPVTQRRLQPALLCLTISATASSRSSQLPTSTGHWLSWVLCPRAPRLACDPRSLIPPQGGLRLLANGEGRLGRDCIVLGVFTSRGTKHHQRPKYTSLLPRLTMWTSMDSGVW